MPHARPFATWGCVKQIGGLNYPGKCGQLALHYFLTQVVNIHIRQYDVGVKDGLAQCIHSLCLCLESGASLKKPTNPYCALMTDISIAFNTLNSDALFQMLLLEPASRATATNNKGAKDGA